ncbi:MAG: LON peptidase substrate-binding domain-containing protein [Gordonia sp. (in: high G+C Gram-positive bacteria)]|uniref:LON peptidase substrate-binding domain-containing protein n=1 Tax=Gordonia sp. (in: high G+C Gram-positive bacteria) TaxID=84139 RepID=UPI0039E71AB7
MTVQPMFPLEHVLLPGEPLRLNVFEPRYRAMVRDLLDGDGTFGVTLIERGSEVGGGDVRTDVGTLALVMGHHELPDGRIMLACQGTDRFTVTRWLPDDPYPRAETEPWPDEPVDPDAWDGIRRRFTTPLAELQDIVDQAAARAGSPSPGPIGAPEDASPTDYTYDTTSALPFTQLDRHAILSAAGPAARIDAMAKALDDVLPLVRARMLPDD